MYISRITHNALGEFVHGIIGGVYVVVRFFNGLARLDASDPHLLSIFVPKSLLKLRKISQPYSNCFVGFFSLCRDINITYVVASRPLWRPEDVRNFRIL